MSRRSRILRHYNRNQTAACNLGIFPFESVMATGFFSFPKKILQPRWPQWHLKHGVTGATGSRTEAGVLRWQSCTVTHADGAPICGEICACTSQYLYHKTSISTCAHSTYPNTYNPIWLDKTPILPKAHCIIFQRTEASNVSHLSYEPSIGHHFYLDHSSACAEDGDFRTSNL